VLVPGSLNLERLAVHRDLSDEKEQAEPKHLAIPLS
jgi:hypothetical protein